jgi:hypothetical protein
LREVADNVLKILFTIAGNDGYGWSAICLK